jgi:hypothetical protein
MRKSIGVDQLLLTDFVGYFVLNWLHEFSDLSTNVRIVYVKAQLLELIINLFANY